MKQGNNKYGRRIVWVSLMIVLLMAPALSFQVLAVASTAAEPDGSLPSLAFTEDDLRHSVSAAELEHDFEQTVARLEAWMVWQRANCPVVDPVRQTQVVAGWTVLVYIAADNNLELAGLADMNEMEGVCLSSQVNVLVQIDRSQGYAYQDGDWTEARRYYIQQDDNFKRITSPVLQNLGEINSGDANSVADFAIWGITNFPAEKYMLVLWDHGGAWISHASDEDTGDDMTLPELTTALDRVKRETGLDKFEVIGFDMCLMGQLEVFQAIEPYARYGLGSEENEPGAGWFYLFLDELVKKPSMDGSQLGRHVVDYFMYFLQEVVGNQDVYGLGVVDLSQGDTVLNALRQFKTAVVANPQASLSSIADARNNTISYGGFNDPQLQDAWSSVDLYRFAEILNDISPVPAVQQAAQGVMQAVESFVIYEDHVKALNGSHGLSIYFPRNVKAYKIGAFNERYPSEVPVNMRDWQDFLNVFHGTATVTVTEAPSVDIIGVYPEVASIYEPAVVTMEVSGRDILRVNYAVTYIINEDERVVLDFDYLVSRTTTTSGADIVDWSDGVTQHSFSWEAEVPKFSDGTTSTYALAIPNLDNPDMLVVNGVYTSVRGGAPVEAQLLFNKNTRQSTALWGLNQTASGNVQPFEIQVETGDQFQPVWLTLDANNELSNTSLGDTLTLTNAQSISFEKVPAPSGTYSISFVAENVNGTTNLSESILQIDNENLDPSLRGYTDLTYGVNFLYPAEWIRPRFMQDGKRLFTAELTTNTILSLFPYSNVNSAAETDAEIRSSWQTLQNLVITQEREVEINDLPAYVTDYTYIDQGQMRMGAVVAIYVPSQGVGYGFDLDAPANNSGPAQAALQALVKSINFFEVQAVVGDSAWQTVTAANGLVSFPVPAMWTEETSGGWTVYGPAGNDAVFTGVAAAPMSGQSNAQMAQFWLGQLESGVQNLEVLASEPFYIGGREWHLVVFTYDGVVKTAGAFFTTTGVGDQDYVFWLEAPDADFDQLYADVFSVIIGGFKFNG